MSARGDIEDRKEAAELAEKTARVAEMIKAGKRLPPWAVQHLAKIARDRLNLLHTRFYRHIASQVVYKVYDPAISISADTLLALVHYLPADPAAQVAPWSRYVDDFLEKFEPVEQQQVWVKA